MKLNVKVWILWIAVSSVVAIILSTGLFINLRDDRVGSIENSISKQLKDIAFSLSRFFEEVEGDVLSLAANPVVRTRDDRDFTSYLGADEATFTYHYGEAEKRIIDLFNTYRTTHRYVNSVYMGRENGSFVRSHPRERPTAYDPRDRPWYTIAKSHPTMVMETEAYPSLTTNDVNIGIVKALITDNDSVYGVIGMDVTLVDLTNYILDYRISASGIVVLLDADGTIVAGKDPLMRARHLREFFPEVDSTLALYQGRPSGRFRAGASFAFFQQISHLDWKVVALIPDKDIVAEVSFPVTLAVLMLLAGLLLCGVLTLVGLRLLVVGPLGKLTEATERVTTTSTLGPRIVIRSRDEIGSLADSFNRMLESLARKEGDLGQYRDHLEELVSRRTAELQEANSRLTGEIQERAAVQRALAERESQYRDLLESANSIILRWRLDGKMVFLNRHAQEFFGYSEPEILGRNIVGTIVEPGTPAAAEFTALATGLKAGAREDELIQRVDQNIRKNGEKVWVTWSNKPIRGRDGEVGEVLSIGADISQLVKTESDLRKALEELEKAKDMAETADRLKSAFLATMSHELRTPLNSIIGFTGILLQKLSGPLNPEQEKQLEMVQGSARHLLSLISDVLDISKIEAGQLKVSFEPVRAGDSIRTVARAIAPLAEKKGLSLLVEVPPEVSTVQTDPRRLEQILLNLLGNAVKFTEKGSVSVRCSVSGGDLVIAVSDTGIGIGAKDLEGLFKPFHQLDTGLTRRFEGTGLGLSISKKLVELLGGSIGVRSIVHEGSTFSIRLPLQRSAR